MKYITKGSIRGCCGHQHGSLKTAVQCLRSDRVGCSRHGGYSDRQIERADGDEMSESEIYAIDDMFDQLFGHQFNIC